MMFMIQMFTGMLLFGAWLWLFPKKASAHCDTMDGPTAKDGMKALETKNIHHAYKWIMPEYEEELRGIFELSLKVRGLSEEAREVADRFFLENLVRIHRAGEGAPFMGLKPHGVPIEPAVAAADRSLEIGNLEPLKGLIEDERFPELEERFKRAMSLREFDPDDVARGRAYIEAYVGFFKFAEGEEHEHGHGHVHGEEGQEHHGSHEHLDSNESHETPRGAWTQGAWRPLKHRNCHAEGGTGMEGIYYGIGVLLLALFVRHFLWFTDVDSGSMSPTIESGERRLTMRAFPGKDYRRGEILVFHSKEYGRDMVKRLIGLPGERVSIRNGSVLVEGNPLREPYIVGRTVYQGEFLVPNGKYFFLGDNRESSIDSRVWEDPFIPRREIKGRIVPKGRYRLGAVE